VENHWSYGVPTQSVQDLVEYWKKSFNWHKIETDINTKLPQFTMPIDAENPHGILTMHSCINDLQIPMLCLSSFGMAGRVVFLR
ncbi:hypothetical protein JB92DRAFT_1694478, partial [Gautieria morchelliformis]